MNYQFLADVDAGLSAPNKFLLSKYFYDEIGDALFVKIMGAPEYYLTKAEHSIFKNQTAEIIDAFAIDNEGFKLIELGAGDGTKTLELLRFLQDDFTFTYLPIDISINALTQLEKRLKTEVPRVKVAPQQGEYFHVLHQLQAIKEPKVILFLGSNLGNMLDKNAHKFVHDLADAMNPNDKLLLGVDLVKPADIVLPAYNDAGGFTRDFNLNLLTRINKEFGANFDISTFSHKPEYTENEGIARSYLTSKVKQDVTVSALEKTFSFDEGEKIHTEISRKYNEDILAGIFKNTGLTQKNVFTDAQQLFADFLFLKE